MIPDIRRSLKNILSRKESFLKHNSIERLSIHYEYVKNYLSQWSKEKKIPDFVKEDIDLCNEYVSWINSLK